MHFKEKCFSKQDGEETTYEERLNIILSPNPKTWVGEKICGSILPPPHL